MLHDPDLLCRKNPAGERKNFSEVILPGRKFDLPIDCIIAHWVRKGSFRSTSVRFKTVFWVIAFVLVLGASTGGCLSSIQETITPSAPSAGPTFAQSPGILPSLAATPAARITASKGTLTDLPLARQKLETRLLQLIDPGSVPQSGNTLEEIRASMIGQDLLVPASEAAKRFDLKASSGTTGDQVYVSIQLQPGTSAGSIVPYVTQVIDSDELTHILVAWVDVNRLDSIASLEGVRSVGLVLPPVQS